MKLMSVRISDIYAPAPDEADDDRVLQIRTDRDSGETLAPIILFWEQGLLYWADGNHRIREANERGDEFIEAVVCEDVHEASREVRKVIEADVANEYGT